MSYKQKINQVRLQYEQMLKEYFGTPYAFTFWKGRVALFAILEAINIGSGDEVILPGFTCVVVPNVIKYLGARPVYVDIDPKTYNIDVSKIEEKITQKTKAIIAQNTFGLPPDLDKILDIANRYGLYVIEDCAHGLGGRYKGRINGTIADAAFFSTQWSKPFSTGLGGIAITNNVEIGQKIEKNLKKYVEPSLREKIILKILLLSYDYLMRPFIYWTALRSYRFLSNNGLVIGSSSADELERPIKPEGFEKRLSNIQAYAAIEALKKINKNIGHRKEVARQYSALLAELGISNPFIPQDIEHSFLRYPLLVNDKRAVLKLAQDKRIEIGDWFVSPLHPIKEGLSKWDYRQGMCPIAEYVSKHLINLPTHQGIFGERLERIKAFVIKLAKMGMLIDGILS